jgi:hypothetical protein
MSNEQNQIPPGNYDCWAEPVNGVCAFPITANKDNWPEITIKIAVAQKGQEEGKEVPFAFAEITQSIDDEEPARGGSDKTPFEYMIDCMISLGAKSREDIVQAIHKGLLSAEGVVIIPGVGALGTKADDKVTHKPANKGGGVFVNHSIRSRRDVPPDARAALAARMAAKMGGAAAGPGKVPAPPAFKPRAAPAPSLANVAPPAAGDDDIPF